MTPFPRPGLRVAMLSLHTSPLAQPGSGDAGGLNVYVRQLALALAAEGTEVDIFTRGAAGHVRIAAGVTVHHVPAGPAGPVPKERIPGLVPELVDGIDAARGALRYDLIHSHYWMSGLAGLRLAERWGVPLVHTMHTMGKVKKHHQADANEPDSRLRAEARLVASASRLTANTPAEITELREHYGADPARVDIVPPGVDLSVFRPSRGRADWPCGEADGASQPRHLRVLFAGRIQKLKGPHILVRALGVLARTRPDLDVRLTIIGALSGTPELNLHRLESEEGIAGRVRHLDPLPPAELAAWFRAADVVAVPSYSESFGLVAMEAQACGTPVAAHDVGGLRHTVVHGRTGVLVPDLSPDSWAAALARLADAPLATAQLGSGAAEFAAGFSWARTAEAASASYAHALGRVALPL